MATNLKKQLYKEILKETNAEIFNAEYKEMIKHIPEKSKKFYNKQFCFLQGYLNGSPMSNSVEEQKQMLKKAGYKNISSDRNFTTMDDVVFEIFEKFVK